MAVPVRNVWTTQPQYNCGIDRGSDMGRRVLGLYNGIGLLVHGLNEELQYSTVVPTREGHHDAQVLVCEVDGAFLKSSVLTGSDIPTSATLFWHGIITGDGNIASNPVIAGVWHNDTAADPYYGIVISRQQANPSNVKFGWNSNGTYTEVNIASRIVYGRKTTFAISVSQNQILAYQDGEQINVQSVSGVNITYGATPRFILGSAHATNLRNAASRTISAGYLRGGSTEAEMVSLTLNPLQLFLPQTRRFFPSATGSTGTVAYTNINDTVAAAGTTTVLGTLARTNINDTSAASGTTTILGTFARTNANDTSAASGTTTVLGTLSTTNANDTVVANGTTTVIGTLARTNANDTVVASGAAGNITGTVNYTNNNDTVVASGTTPGSGGSSGGFLDYGENKRIHAGKKLLIDAEELIAEIKEEPAKIEEYFDEAADITLQLKKEIARLEVKVQQFNAENRRSEMIHAQLIQEQLAAQIEEIDTVFVLFMMVAQID